MTTSTQSESAAKKHLTRLQRAIVDGLQDVKAQDIQVFDTGRLTPLFERVIVATGASNRQTRALAASVRDAVRDAGLAKPRTEGEDNGEWIIVDCGAAVAHIMQPAIRQYYRLEELWGEKPLRLKPATSPAATAAASGAAGQAAARKTAGTARATRSAKPVEPIEPAKTAASASKPRAAKAAPARKTAAAANPASKTPAPKAARAGAAAKSAVGKRAARSL